MKRRSSTAGPSAPDSARSRARSPSPSKHQSQQTKKKNAARKSDSSITSRLQIAMDRYPLLTNGCIAAVINAAGVIASQAIKRELGSNWMMVLIFSIIGAFVVTPLVILVLVGVIFRKNLQKYELLFACTLFGCLIIGPAFEISFKFLIAFFDENNDMCLKPMARELFGSIFSKSFLITQLQSRVVFFPADVLNIYFIPPVYTPIVGNMAGFIWTIFLAFTTNAPK